MNNCFGFIIHPCLSGIFVKSYQSQLLSHHQDRPFNNVVYDSIFPNQETEDRVKVRLMTANVNEAYAY